MNKLYRYKATLEYDGSNYHGCQIQGELSTVAKAVEQAILAFSGVASKISCASRTDAGVHARGQIIHFDLPKKYDAYTLTCGLNFHLKAEAVKIVKANLTNVDFHARYGAKYKNYKYLILNRNAPSPLLYKRAWHQIQPIDLNKMRQASKLLLGQHDFTSFMTQDKKTINPLRQIDKISISKTGEVITINFAAESFLYNQIRIMVGTLVEIAQDPKAQPELITKIFAAQDRTKAGQTAPAHGLYLEKISYRPR